MIYTDTLRGAYSRRHGITWCIPAVYTSQPTQRVPAAVSPSRLRARKTPEKYNSTISGAYALESLRAIIHACRMLLPWQLPPTCTHTDKHMRACVYMRHHLVGIGQCCVGVCVGVHVCARNTVPCPRARECIGKYDITHGKVPGHLCRVNY